MGSPVRQQKIIYIENAALRQLYNLWMNLLFDELGNGSAVVGGEDADEVDSAFQVIDIDGVQLLGLSVAAHDLATAQIVDRDLPYGFGTLHIKHARGRIREYADIKIRIGVNAYIVVHVFHTQVAHAGENDVVHPSAVAAADDTRVLLVAESEGVRTKIDREGGL